MDKFNEPGYEPAAMTSEEFVDYCLDLYDDIKFGKRKARKRAAQTLVLCATRLEENLGTALRKVQSLKNDISMLEGMFAHAGEGDGASPWAGTDWDPDRKDCVAPAPEAPSYPHTATIEEARSCVINEHAHGDDAHYPPVPPLEHGTCRGADGRIHDYRGTTTLDPEPVAGQAYSSPLDAYQNWAHSDPMVNAKVVCQDTEPCDPALPKEKAPGSKRGGSPS